MSHMTWREKRYRRAHLSCARHITLDPKGPGVVRIHMIPPRTESPEDPFLLLLNGAQLVPLTLSWAVLLANFMDRLEPFSGCEISEEDWAAPLTRRTAPIRARTARCCRRISSSCSARSSPSRRGASRTWPSAR